MSMARAHTANLPGYGAPIYPPLLPGLVEAFTKRHPNGLGLPVLTEAAKRCAGFIRVSQGLRTADSYIWRCSLGFNVHGGVVIVALPQSGDTSSRDGTQLDRSPAVYVKGDEARRNVEATANDVVARLTRALLAVQS